MNEEVLAQIEAITSVLCPQNCSGNGTCISGVCLCFTGKCIRDLRYNEFWKLNSYPIGYGFGARHGIGMELAPTDPVRLIGWTAAELHKTSIARTKFVHIHVLVGTGFRVSEISH